MTTVIFGEAMLEYHSQGGSGLRYGGDTLNSAVYLARQGIAVDYVTALGDDPMSAWMVEQWRGQGVGCELVDYQPNAVPGLYLTGAATFPGAGVWGASGRNCATVVLRDAA